MGRSFDGVMKMGQIVEYGIEYGKVISFSSLTTVHKKFKWCRKFRVKKKKDNIGMVMQDSQYSIDKP